MTSLPSSSEELLEGLEAESPESLLEVLESEPRVAQQAAQTAMTSEGLSESLRACQVGLEGPGCLKQEAKQLIFCISRSTNFIIGVHVVHLELRIFLGTPF